MKKIAIVLVLLGVILFGVFIYFREGTLPPNEQAQESKRFVIDRGESLDSISKRLEAEGLIRNRLVFYLVVKQLGIETQIQAGSFNLSPTLDAYEIANSLTVGTDDIWITIVEGLRKEEIAEEISKSLPISTTEFVELADEGYLFPDTYLVSQTASAEAIVDLMTSTFEEKYTEEMKQKAQDLGLTTYEVLTLASLVEREARTYESRVEVASVMLRRLNDDYPLQIDATVQYVLGYQPDEKLWWTQNLTLEDLEIESPYNTYVNPGLPPTPIANPSLSSIEAVVNADPNTPYYFYITGNDGKMYYAEDFEEHQRNIDAHLN